MRQRIAQDDCARRWQRMSLFDTSPVSADWNGERRLRWRRRMRPRTLEEFVGQEHLLGPGKPLRLAIETR